MMNGLDIWCLRYECRITGFGGNRNPPCASSEIGRFYNPETSICPHCNIIIPDKVRGILITHTKLFHQKVKCFLESIEAVGSSHLDLFGMNVI